MCKFIIVLFGPTGVGKSSLAEKLARKFSGEIVNADVGQFYLPFSIGTAKPEWKDNPIAHHLFDILDSPKNLTVCDYRSKLIECVKDIHGRKNVPIVVGGSTFYLLSLFFPPLSLAANIKKNIDRDGSQDLWQKLYDIDPVRAQELSKNDEYRIKRALDIWESSGIKPSKLKPPYNPVSRFIYVYVDRDRSQLYERIDKRTIEMVRDGWIEEVEAVKEKKWKKFLCEKKLIGYPDVLDYLEGKIATKDELINIIQKKTRNYAKRQICFGKMILRKLKTAQEEDKLHSEDSRSKEISVNLTDEQVEKKLEELEKMITQFAAKIGK
ncbi:tRNA (adenosine(37)-N6)-dimethylallyltransferase MiaA [bacterium]|jgi:tRNA dimethylallyltransferase|nr:tRNA (adenosine(37)-N6)-dimethylallyltransferase MiaA [bacterium]